MYTIARSVDESDDDTIAAAGIDPAADDLVVLVTRFASPVEDRVTRIRALIGAVSNGIFLFRRRLDSHGERGISIRLGPRWSIPRSR